MDSSAGATGSGSACTGEERKEDILAKALALSGFHVSSSASALNSGSACTASPGLYEEGRFGTV